MRILLIQPDYLSQGIGFRVVALPEPLHLEMVAATVPDHDVCILDMRLDGDLEAVLSEFQPDMAAVTALTPEVYAARDILSRIKTFNPDIFTVVGGHHATLLPQDFFLPQVDAIALGEAEHMFGQLARYVAGRSGISHVPNLIWRQYNGEFIANHRSHTCIDLARLPLPRRDLTDAYRDEYFFLFDKPDTSMATSRGCPYRCNFCSVHEFYGGKVNQMSPERVLREIAAVTTSHITFVDDNFLMNHRRENEIADRIKAIGLNLRFSLECRTDSIVRHPELLEKWVDIGLYAVLLGLEGATNETLQNVNKAGHIATNNRAIEILQANGVIIWGAFIVDPDWTEDDFKQLSDYVRDKKITHTQFTILTPLPGTQLFRQRHKDILTNDYTAFDTLHAVLPTCLPLERFYQCFADLYRQTDVQPYYDLVRAGKMTIEDCKHGKMMLDAMADWERYLDKDLVPTSPGCNGR
ncbi:MAG: radical SAM protein [Sedimentisphaerales bacterium]|nr:radical SAM protein [Sedimentisphaerales bacterium]